MLGLIDSTTNWYIRFNRKRLKGENGLEDTKHALNTLFEVLYTLCRGLAPFIPFLTDKIYMLLLPLIPKEMQAKDPRSVHFLEYPQVRKELFNPEVERRVGRMQKIIDLGRLSRERRAIGVKTPLKTLVVIHSDPTYLEDVRSLESYIAEELNIRDLVLTSDEAKYNVEYSVSADWPVLGKKLKKDMAKVKKGLAEVTSGKAKAFMETGKITVAGIELVEGDLIVKKGMKEDTANKNLEANTDNEVLTILDSELYEDLKHEGLAREIINRVQRLRKKAGLQVTDDIKMEYKVLSDPEELGLAEVFNTQASFLEKALRRPMDKHEVTQVEGEMSNGKEPGMIMEEMQEIQQATFLLRLLEL